MNLNEFKIWTKTVSVEVLDLTFDEISAKLAKARSPAIKMGYAIALDELVLEKGFRSAGYGAIDPNDSMSIDDILKELGE